MAKKVLLTRYELWVLRTHADNLFLKDRSKKNERLSLKLDKAFAKSLKKVV